VRAKPILNSCLVAAVSTLYGVATDSTTMGIITVAPVPLIAPIVYTQLLIALAARARSLCTTLVSATVLVARDTTKPPQAHAQLTSRTARLQLIQLVFAVRVWTRLAMMQRLISAIAPHTRLGSKRITRVWTVLRAVTHVRRVPSAQAANQAIFSRRRLALALVTLPRLTTRAYTARN
jgi:hypothetical protein